MPRFGPYLNAGEIATITAWIDEGALEAAPVSMPIPTMSEWGTIILALSLMVLGTIYILYNNSEPIQKNIVN